MKKRCGSWRRSTETWGMKKRIYLPWNSHMMVVVTCWLLCHWPRNLVKFEHISKLPSLKLTYDSTWEWMLGIRFFPFGALKRPIFGGKLAVSFRECICLDLKECTAREFGLSWGLSYTISSGSLSRLLWESLCIKQCSRMRYPIESCFLICGSHESEKIYIPKSWLKGQINQLSSYCMLPLFPRTFD